MKAMLAEMPSVPTGPLPPAAGEAAAGGGVEQAEAGRVPVAA